MFWGRCATTAVRVEAIYMYVDDDDEIMTVYMHLSIGIRWEVLTWKYKNVLILREILTVHLRSIA